jgi:Cu2+-exporting ATPase
MNHSHHQIASGDTKHAGHSPNMFREKFWLSLILTIAIVLYSPMVQEWLGFQPPIFPGSEWLSSILGTIVFFYGGMVFIKGAIAELRAKTPGMMTLISLAIIAAYAYSLATTFFIQGTEFFWELATLITIMLFGHWMEMKSVQSAEGALKELAKFLPDEAELITGDTTRKVAVSELKVGDVVLVRPGGKVPADGEVVEGESSVNESMITGESKPVNKIKGSKVIAGTVNSSGTLQVRVRQIGENTALAGIMRLVAEAQASQSRSQILADKAAYYLTIIAILSGFGTLIGWLIAGAGLAFAMERTVGVLVIACPHALGLAVPLVTAISTSLAARNGLLIRRRMALESARNVDVVLFDKTGTLTKGEQGIVDVWSSGNYSENSVLSLAAAVEALSEHMVGKAIVEAARSRKMNISKAEKFQSFAGKGVQAMVEGKTILVGGPQLLNDKKIKVQDIFDAAIQKAKGEGKAIIYVLEKEEVIGTFSLTDVIRSESKEAIFALQKMGIRTAMITGDSRDVAKSVADELGIKEYFAEVLPAHKVDKVKELQKDGSRVAMVGDGVNDAPALTQANIGIAIGAGTDVAIESAGIILVKNDPRDVVKVIRLSQSTYKKMVQNLVWATGYNVVAIPLAAGVLAGQGIILPPAIGALFMSASTIIVAINAQLLRRLNLGNK